MPVSLSLLCSTELVVFLVFFVFLPAWRFARKEPAVLAIPAWVRNENENAVLGILALRGRLKKTFPASFQPPRNATGRILSPV
jgi:hypothetical protein